MPRTSTQWMSLKTALLKLAHSFKRFMEVHGPEKMTMLPLQTVGLHILHLPGLILSGVLFSKSLFPAPSREKDTLVRRYATMGRRRSSSWTAKRYHSWIDYIFGSSAQERSTTRGRNAVRSSGRVPNGTLSRVWRVYRTAFKGSWIWSPITFHGVV